MQPERPSGMTGRENDMNTTLSQTTAATRSGVMPILFALAIGLGLVFVAGLSQASALHDTAHDTRHAMAFPCH